MDNGQGHSRTDAAEASLANTVISYLLRAGVIMSAAIIALGVILFIVTGRGGYAADTGMPAVGGQYTAFHANTPAALYIPTTPGEIGDGVMAGKPFAIIMGGLALLMLTPLVREALVTLALARTDCVFLGIGLFVLAMLLLSFALGKAAG